MKIDVRRVQPSADLDELLGNLIAIREELDLPEALSAQELRSSLEQIANTPTSYLLVASIEDRPLGFALAHALGHETPLTATRLVIDVLFVPTSERRRGIGHALLQGLSNEADLLGAAEVLALPAAQARAAQRFFARAGFASASSYRRIEPLALHRNLSDAPVVRPLRQRSSVDHLIARRRITRDKDIS